MGPLAGLKVIEIAGVGPGPFCGMMLADMGADVLRIDRLSGSAVGVDIPFDPKKDVLARGRRSVALDLKNPAAADFVLHLVEKADILFEGFRPGVIERLGLGPAECHARNAKLVYGRMTGWGQTGPLAPRAGHDINYIALSGALDMIGRAGDKPVPPVNLVGDFGGGGMVLALGLLAAVIEARNSGRGQVVDAAMVEGSALLTAMRHAMVAMNVEREGRGVNSGDTGAHFYEVYETADGKFMAVGSAEPQFYRAFLKGLGVDEARFADQMNPAGWDMLKREVAAAFKQKTQLAWRAIFEGVDACVTPVLSPSEAPSHPHNIARQSFVTVDGIVQPAPAPRFDRTPSEVLRGPPMPGQGADAVLDDWGVDQALRLEARAAGALA